MAPKKGSKLRRKYGIFVYCDLEEKRTIKAEAKLARQSMSQFCLTPVLARIEKEREKRQG